MKQQNHGVPDSGCGFGCGFGWAENWGASMILVAGRYYTKRSNLGVPAARMSEKGLFWEQVLHRKAESWGTCLMYLP